MNTLTLSPAGRPYLAEQATQNGTFTHLLRDAQGIVRGMANVIVEQCDQAISVQVELGDSRNSITLARRADAGERIARFVEEIANGVETSSVPEADEHELVSEEEAMLRDAIRLGRGTYYLPTPEDFDLCLCLRPHMFEQAVTNFRFELNDEVMTLWARLPADRQRAYELLAGCVRALVANYRSGAAA
jgi:hypothetical protein